mmetsp:Transcript_9680/g.17445  ORF Transcript_9680/g.17445 Transcript_9680/m.17445 type:complete len:557 (-) Transcript_9680:837-2507(-)
MEPNNTSLVREGLAKAHYTKGEVFYNPVQVMNRDLSVLVLREYVSMVRKENPAKEHISCLEGLSASGLRAARYALEVPGLRPIIANDSDPAAFATISENLTLNSLSSDIARPNLADANVAARSAASILGITQMQKKHLKPSFDVIDLDPYGSAAPFLDSAVAGVSPGGLLCITSTDKAALCGGNAGVAFSRYGGIPIKGGGCHEGALRMVLYALQNAAGKIGRSIEPLLCVSIDFYVRLFVRIRDSKVNAQRAAQNTSIVAKCPHCNSISVQPLAQLPNAEPPAASKHQALEPENAEAANNSAEFNTENHKDARKRKKTKGGDLMRAASLTLDFSEKRCRECGGGGIKIYGPMWSGRLYSHPFVESLYNRVKRKVEISQEPNSNGMVYETQELRSALAMRERVGSLLRVVLEETQDAVLMMELPEALGLLKLNGVKLITVLHALRSLGYQSSVSHTSATGIKTTAPSAVFWDVLRTIAKSKENEHTPLEDSCGARILAKEVSSDLVARISLEESESDSQARKKQRIEEGARFPPNPERHWGPKKAARGRASTPPEK